ncbi:MAG: type II toxin-antitoxin system RelE/ParE family toxin [Nanoarchaeota archaeon]|nr:type II toxin-antitoxin system RelE/ParE family toxin [Nanoarchaeota archaeon]
MYSIELTKKAKTFLKKIPKKDAEIILKKLYSLRINPFPFLKRLQGYKLWRLRVLKYRVVLDIVISGQKIIVLRIGHRKNIYDK